jgi:peroxiredoxin Q/BCP
VVEAWGAWGTKVLYGRAIEGIIRSTFVVDVDASGAGRIAVAQYNVRATGHVARLRRELGV